MISFLIIGLIVFTLCSGFLSGTETAMFSLSSIKVRTYQHSHDDRKRLIARLVLHPRDLLVTILMLNIFANIMVQNFASSLFGSFAGWSLRVGVPLAITLVFGEIIPKSLAIRNNERLAPIASPVISSLQSFFGPIRKVIIGITGAISRVLFFFLSKESPVTKKELQHMLKASKNRGVLFHEEAELIQGYLNLQETNAKELMHPREDIVCYDIGDPIAVLRDIFVEKKFSRVPVYDGDLDNIIGVATARRFLLHRHNISDPEDLRPFLRKAFFIPETTPAKSLFSQYRENDEALALVVDEYGSIAGVITREDLFEEVVGRIAEHHDEKPLYTRSADDIIIASGRLEIDDVEEVFDIELPSPNNMVTIGGWLIEELGDIPSP
ncbi:MAG: HlyC/CorC family transporter, partial [Waddliaceae bacterium]|nr:HlyC/CorC family transporter [Waddliaceae bacterium]